MYRSRSSYRFQRKSSVTSARTCVMIMPYPRTETRLTERIMDDLEQLFADMEALLERIVSQQRDKVMAVALDILPHLQPEDIQDPQDYAEVAADTMFNYEDGLLAGLLSARAVLRSNIIEVYRTRAAHGGQ